MANAPCTLIFGRGPFGWAGQAIVAVFGLSFQERYACRVFRAWNTEFVLRRLG